MSHCAMITALSTAQLIWRFMEATWSTQRDLWWELKDKLNANQASIWKESLSVARRQIWFVHPPIMDLSGVSVNMTHSPVVKSWKGKFEFLREACLRCGSGAIESVSVLHWITYILKYSFVWDFKNSFLQGR